MAGLGRAGSDFWGKLMKRLARIGKGAVLAALMVGAVALLTQSGISHAREIPLRVFIRGVKPIHGTTADIKIKPRVGGFGRKAKLTYRWESLQGPPLNERITKVEELVIPKTELRAGAVYKLRVKVKAEWPDPKVKPPSKKTITREGSAEVTFRINSPPHSGRCLVEASRVGKQKAMVRANAPGWRDDERLPIHYRFAILKNGEKVHERGWSGSPATQVRLDVELGDRLQAECYTRDRHKSESAKLSSVLNNY